MTKRPWCCLGAALLLLSALVPVVPAGAQEASHYLIDTGPLRVRDQFPLGMAFLAFDPAPASILASREWQIDAVVTVTNTFAHSNEVERFLEERDSRLPFGQAELDVIAADTPGGGVFLLDGELYRTAIALRRGLGAKSQVEISVPVLSYQGGVVDSLIEGFHDTFSFSQAGRRGVARDRFLAFARGESGELNLIEDPGTELGDVVLGYKRALRERTDGEGFELAFSTLLKLPTGDDRRLSGSGSPDLGAQLLATRFFPKSCVHLALGLLALGEWEKLGIESQVLPSIMAAYELGLSSKASALAQVTMAKTPFDDLALPELQATSIQLTLGYKRVFREDHVLFLGLTENVQNFNNTSDIGFHFGVTRLFGGSE